MAGGIFADQPFHANMKCIIIGVILMILYWTLPYRNPFMLQVIFVVGYISIAWYDYLYNCTNKMYSGTFPIGTATLDAWAKPQLRFGESADNDIDKPILVKDQELAYKKKIYALHALFIAPLLGYVGWHGNKSNKNIWSVIGSIGFLVVLYHGLRIFYPRQVTTCIKENEEERKNLVIIYIFHLLAIAPLLLYIAYRGTKSDNMVWNPLLILSMVTFTYHGTRYFYPRIVNENC